MRRLELSQIFLWFCLHKFYCYSIMIHFQVCVCISKTLSVPTFLIFFTRFQKSSISSKFRFFQQVVKDSDHFHYKYLQYSETFKNTRGFYYMVEYEMRVRLCGFPAWTWLWQYNWRLQNFESVTTHWLFSSASEGMTCRSSLPALHY